MHHVITANARGCYCRPGQTTCGTCERCGAAGHTRGSPGPRPYTGAWCDRCYDRLRWRQVASWMPWFAAAALATLVLWRFVVGGE